MLVSGRRWNLRLKGGIEVRLPEECDKALQRDGVDPIRDEALLSRAVSVVDLRQGDRAILRLTPEAAKAPEEPGEST